jgi:hypothetical protein
MLAGSYDLYKPSFDIYGPVSSSMAYQCEWNLRTGKIVSGMFVHYKTLLHKPIPPV